MKKRTVLLTVLAVIVGISLCYADGEKAVKKGDGNAKKEAAAVVAKSAAAETSVKMPNAGMTQSKIANIKVREPKLKEIAIKAPTFREPRFRNNAGALVTSSKASFNTGNANFNTGNMQVKHMQKIMRGQVDYAVSVGGGSGN